MSTPNPKTKETEQAILNKSFDPSFDVLAFENLGYDASSGTLVRQATDANGNVLTSNAAKALQYKVKSDNVNIYYLGLAPIGTATSAAAWQIRRMTFTSTDISVDWADGDGSSNNVYDDRESITYS